jgi:RNA polymerase sigma factor (sigma-70 family)
VDIITRNERVMLNQGLVPQVARGFKGRGLPFDDLMQAGNLGLISAAERFEPERGLRFSTYAVFWIRQALYKAVEMTGRPIRVPSQARTQARAVLAHEREIEARDGANVRLPIELAGPPLARASFPVAERDEAVTTPAVPRRSVMIPLSQSTGLCTHEHRQDRHRHHHPPDREPHAGQPHVRGLCNECL